MRHVRHLEGKDLVEKKLNCCTDKPIIKVPGCPPIPDVMSAIITYMVTFDRLPDVDRMGRPLMF